jgi:AAA15 family ATPase/GTPase
MEGSKMLIELRVTNFKSFKEEQVLSMIASSDKALLENTIAAEALGDRRLIRSAVVYGANASGKSNLVDAFAFVRSFVQSSVEREPDARIPTRPFLLDEKSIESPSGFELSFIHRGVRYQYGFSVDHRRVQEEWLIAYPKGRAQTWFERPSEGSEDPDNWYFGPKLGGDKKRLVKLLRPNVLFLSVAAKFAHEQLSQVYDWFSGYLRTANLGDFPSVQGMEQYTARALIKNEKLHAVMKDFLRLADLGISDVVIEARSIADVGFPIEAFSEVFSEKVRSQLDGQELLEVRMQHQVEGCTDSVAAFSLEDESCGTRRFFAISVPWLQSLARGYTLVVDEIDSSLHPSLVRALIEMFHSPELNRTDAQLIFNTHDTTQLDHALFRRDQIWFVEKDDAGASHIYPLLEFRPRKGEALEKGYLQGRYGAIPFIGSLEGFVLDVEA